MPREPRTLVEAKIYRYGTWAGNPKGRPYNEGKCAYELMHDMLFSQCSRNAGHGPEELYCKQHAKKVGE
jgi:hypothetical protein